MIEAKDCKCVECGKPAVAFWPVIDPDIDSHPYCRKCLDKVKEEMLVKLFGWDEKEAKAYVKIEKEYRKRKIQQEQWINSKK